MAEQKHQRYVLDANVFISAHRRYYARDLCPGFWSFLEHYAPKRLISIDRVRNELDVNDDDLARWVKTNGSRLFISTNDIDTHLSYGNIANWLNNEQRYKAAQKDLFLRGADGWLVAYARTNGLIVVTEEINDPTYRKVKIPDVCDQFNVRYMNTVRMLRDLGASFGWTPQS